MKIAFVINKSWNIYNFRLSLIKALQNDGHEIIAIAPRDEFSDKLITEGCKFIDLPLAGRGLNPINDFGLFLTLVSIFSKEKPDLVLSYTIKPNIYGSFAAQYCKIPIICNVTGLGTVFIRKNPVYKIAHWLYKLAFLYPHKVFFQNNDDYTLFIQNGLVNIAKAEITAGSGVDIAKFYPAKPTLNQTFTFLLVSRILKDKGIIEFIEAIKMLRAKGNQSIFQLVGLVEEENHAGISRQNIDDWQNENLIEYKGFAEEVLPYYQMADCVVLPSYREGMPKSLLEAMATAKPIITTNVAGCRDLVQNGENGFVCESKNYVGLANAMETICNLDKQKLMQMGKRSREIVTATYDEKFVIYQYIHTINQVTNTTHGI